MTSTIKKALDIRLQAYRDPQHLVQDLRPIRLLFEEISFLILGLALRVQSLRVNVVLGLLIGWSGETTP